MFPFQEAMAPVLMKQIFKCLLQLLCKGIILLIKRVSILLQQMLYSIFDAYEQPHQ